MKVKKSEIQLLIAVIGVLIAVCTYFLVYSSFNEKSDALEAQNVTLSSQVATLEALDQRKADYIEATEKMQSYITNFENRFPADILPEDSIMMVKTLEDYTRTEVANIAFGSEAEVVYTPATDAATTTADATACHGYGNRCCGRYHSSCRNDGSKSGIYGRYCLCRYPYV
ncbi:MAG: hypothetical protein ACLTAX_06915 [Waltera sp.]